MPRQTQKKTIDPYTVDVVKILTAMIDRPEFSSRIAELAEAQSKLINNETFELVLQWILTYNEKAGEPPTWEALIEWATQYQTSGKTDSEGFGLASELADLIGRMESRKFKYAKTPIADLETTAENFFQSESLARLTIDLEQFSKSPELAQAALESYTPPTFEKDDAFDLLLNASEFVASADNWGTGESLVDWTRDVHPAGETLDDLNEFFGNCIMPGSFVAFVGRAKVGKSFWLVDATIRGALSGQRVLYIQCGDMPSGQSRERVLNRICSRAAMPTKIELPKKFILKNGKWFVKKAIPKTPKKLMPPKIREAMVRKFFETKCENGAWIKTLQFSKGELTSKQIDRMAKRYKPTILVIDFVDLLFEPAGMDKRHAVERNWGELRAIALRHETCVVTATQSDARGYKSQWLGLENFSDSKDKNGHCSDMIGINQSDDEKKSGIYRLNWVARRNAISTDRIMTANCLSIANPAVISKRLA